MEETRNVTKVFDPGERHEAATTITPQRTATYRVMIDWAGSSDFIGPYDNVTDDVLGSTGISIERGRDSQRASGGAMVPAASFTLSNAKGTYNPNLGPLSASLLPGRNVRIEATFGQDSTTMSSQYATMQDAGLFTSGEVEAPLFRGVLEDLSVNPSLGTRTVDIRALGSLLKLRGRKVSTQLYQNITTGQAVNALLSAAEIFDAIIDPVAISSGRQLRWWWANGDLYDALIQLLETEGPPAALYENGRGRIVFEGRLYRSLAPRSTAPQGWFRDTDSEGFYLTYSDIRYEPGLRDIINDVTVTLETREADADVSVVWQHPEDIAYLPITRAEGGRYVSAAAAPSVLVETDEPFVDAIAPSEADGDFTWSVTPPPPGTFLPPVVTTLTGAALSRTSGSSTLITFNATGNPITISNLRLRAKKVPVKSSLTVTTDQTTAITASKAKFGVRPLSPNVVRTLVRTDAELLTDTIANAYADIRPTATIEFTNINNAHMVQALTREVSDRVHLISSALGVDDAYLVEKVTHEINEAGTHKVSLGLEKAPRIAKVGQWLQSGGTTSVWGADGSTTNVGLWG